jgi:hypothetical protein
MHLDSLGYPDLLDSLNVFKAHLIPGVIRTTHSSRFTGTGWKQLLSKQVWLGLLWLTLVSYCPTIILGYLLYFLLFPAVLLESNPWPWDDDANAPPPCYHSWHCHLLLIPIIIIESVFLSFHGGEHFIIRSPSLSVFQTNCDFTLKINSNIYNLGPML